MSDFEKRLTPARPDLAASYLRGKVEATRFVDGVTMQVVDVSAPLRSAPTSEAMLDTEALHGEHVVIYEETDEGWCWGQLARDRYVGWLPSNALAKESAKPAHRVRALRTFIFPKSDIKSPPMASLSSAARSRSFAEEGDVRRDREWRLYSEAAPRGAGFPRAGCGRGGKPVSRTTLSLGAA